MGKQKQKSSGEKAVEEFLESNHIPFLTQFQTLKCVNPETNAILPYDFEIPGRKLIIEVQGRQHLKYNQHFHKKYDEFLATVKRDRYKKKYARNLGYRVVYLTYSDIESGEYKRIISAIL